MRTRHYCIIAFVGVSSACAPASDVDGVDLTQMDQAHTSLAAKAGTHGVGAFQLTWAVLASGGSPTLRISHAREPSRVIWESPSDAPFVQARLFKTTFQQWRGSFTIHEKGRQDCSTQTLDRVETTEEGGLEFQGQLGPSCAVGYRLAFNPSQAPSSDGHLSFRLSLDPKNPITEPDLRWRAVLRNASEPAEKLFGFGEQYTFLNQKGRRLPILVQEQGHGRGLQPLTALLNTVGMGAGGSWYSTYAAVPQYISSLNRSVFLENYEYSVFDMSAPTATSIEVDSGEMHGRILYGASPLDLIEEYTKYAGRMVPLPKWMGAGLVAGLQGGSKAVREHLEVLHRHRVPIAAVWAQDWVGERSTPFGIRLWWNWELDHKSYPDWDNLVSENRARGIRMLGYINPFLTDPSSKPGVVRRNLFLEGSEKGYLLKGRDGKPSMVGSGGFDAALVDLSNEQARAWLKGVIRDQLIGSGLSGWMADFGEAVSLATVPASGEPASTFHHRYPEEWARLNREAIREANLEGEVVSFHRSGYTKSPGYTSLFWVGDQLVSWDAHDGMKTAVTSVLSSGFSGYSITHSDIGGCIAFDYLVYKIKRTPELVLRWMELGAFSPVFRNHEGNNPKTGGTQMYSEESFQGTVVVDALARNAQIFATLNGYRQKVMEEAASKGYPVMRHPALHYPNDPQAWALEYQFMLGADFMVAPVLDPGVSKVQVYLPAGEWVHVWTGAKYGSADRGVWVTVPAPIGQPGVLYRSDSVAGAEFVQHLKNKNLL